MDIGGVENEFLYGVQKRITLNLAPIFGAWVGRDQGVQSPGLSGSRFGSVREIPMIGSQEGIRGPKAAERLARANFRSEGFAI